MADEDGLLRFDDDDALFALKETTPVSARYREGRIRMHATFFPYRLRSSALMTT